MKLKGNKRARRSLAPPVTSAQAVRQWVALRAKVIRATADLAEAEAVLAQAAERERERRHRR